MGDFVLSDRMDRSRSSIQVVSLSTSVLVFMRGPILRGFRFGDCNQTSVCVKLPFLISH